MRYEYGVVYIRAADSQGEFRSLDRVSVIVKLRSLTGVTLSYYRFDADLRDS